MHEVVLAVALVPYLYYGGKDNLFHFRGRRVSWAEHLLHLAVGVTLFIAISQAFAGRQGPMLGGLLLFMVAGGLDEFWFHRGLPQAESDLHAKAHLALLIFVIVALALGRLRGLAGWIG